MYNFVDTIETSEGITLPSEALQINGEYIENLIDGYRTVHVEGRESLSPDLTTYDTGIRDGSRLQSKRYPARVITVTYQLIAKTNEDFRAAYNKLGGILNVEDAQLIFNDEQDKYFVGTPSAIGAVNPGLNSVIGEFEILCTDPFKYSVMEYEAAPNLEESSVIIDYNGTYKAFPTLEASFFNEEEASEDGETVTELTGSGDCGFVAFFNDEEKIIQLGDPEEIDGIEGGYPKSQTLVNSTFKTSSAWGSAAKSQWKVNSGVTTSSSWVEQKGTPGMAIATYSARNATKTSSVKTRVYDGRTTQGAPLIHYWIDAVTSNRKANSVKVELIVHAQFIGTGHYIGNGYGISLKLRAHGNTYIVPLKIASERWEGNKMLTRNFVYTVTGLSASDKMIPTGQTTFEAYRTDKVNDSGMGEITGMLGSIKMNPYEVVYDVPDTYYLTASDYGTGTNHHGPSISRVLPEDQNGDVGAANFTLSYAQRMSIGSGSKDTNQYGGIQVMLTTGSGTNRTIVAGVAIYKEQSGKNGKLRFYVNGKAMQTVDVDLSYNNKYFTTSKTSTITKSGQTVTFDICGIKKTFRDSAIKDVVVNEVTFALSKFGSKPALSYNGVCWVKFVKDNCETWKNIPNKFSANDVVTADCKTGEIQLNGVSKPALGALGNDWEGFYLTPGINQIGITYSDFEGLTGDYAPRFKVKYREVFL